MVEFELKKKKKNKSNRTGQYSIRSPFDTGMQQKQHQLQHGF